MAEDYAQAPRSQIEQWLEEAGQFNDRDMPDEAMSCATRVIALEPNNYKALYLMGSVMLKSGHNNEAQQFLRRVAELKPAAHQSWGNLSIACAEAHRYEEAITFAERAIACKKAAKPHPDPKVERDDWTRVYADASFAHSTANNWAKAREYAVRSLRYDPTFKDTLFHLANVDLAEQKWTAGWAGYKTSEGTKWRKKYNYGDTQEWNGEPGAVVMVTGEQGLGDEVMAASVIPDAIARAGQFIFDCDHRCGALFSRSFPQAIIAPTRNRKEVALPVAPTHHKSLFGLCELFRNADSDFPRKAYLVPNAKYVSMFRALFASIVPRPVIGLAWSGGFLRTGQLERTAGISAFLPLMRREDALFVSLQYKDEAAEVMAYEAKTGMRVLRLPWAAQAQDIDLVAALIAACDEVIGVATAALHIASAMGVRTTWLCNRGLNWVFAPDELLWYPPTAQIWRKDRGESWRECIGQLAAHRAEQRKAAA